MPSANHTHHNFPTARAESIERTWTQDCPKFKAHEDSSDSLVPFCAAIFTVSEEARRCLRHVIPRSWKRRRCLGRRNWMQLSQGWKFTSRTQGRRLYGLRVSLTSRGVLKCLLKKCFEHMRKHHPDATRPLLLSRVHQSRFRVHSRVHLDTISESFQSTFGVRWPIHILYLTIRLSN